MLVVILLIATKDSNKYALLGLSLLSFCHDHTDIQLMINSGVLKLLGDLVASRQEQLIAATDEERKDDYVLNERVILCSSQLLQLIAIRTGSVTSLCVWSTYIPCKFWLLYLGVLHHTSSNVIVIH